MSSFSKNFHFYLRRDHQKNFLWASQLWVGRRNEPILGINRHCACPSISSHKKMLQYKAVSNKSFKLCSQTSPDWQSVQTMANFCAEIPLKSYNPPLNNVNYRTLKVAAAAGTGKHSSNCFLISFFFSIKHQFLFELRVVFHYLKKPLD